MARDTIAVLVKITYSMLDQLTPQQRKDIEEIMPYLQKWHGEMHEDSIAASIYSVWQMEFYKTLFHQYINRMDIRLTITNNYPFLDFY